MIKVLQIRETPTSKSDGLDANVQGLIKLFEGDDALEFLPTTDYRVHHVPIINQSYIDKTDICKSIEKYRPNIVHIHGAYSFTLLVAVKCAKKYGIPIVFSPHFHPFWALRRPFLGKVFFHAVTKRILNDVNTVFTINNEDTAIFRKYHNKVKRIPHWSKFKVPETKPSKNPRMILFVGRLNESNKGFEHLYYLPEDKYEIHCVGKGDVELRSDMIMHTNISNEELVNLYREASLLVVPSRYEAFSYVTLEALANYTPVVVSDRVRIADYLQNESGVSIFNYQDYDDFVEKVEKTIGKEIDPKRISVNFSPEKIKEEYKAAYLSVV